MCVCASECTRPNERESNNLLNWRGYAIDVYIIIIIIIICGEHQQAVARIPEHTAWLHVTHTFIIQRLTQSLIVYANLIIRICVFLFCYAEEPQGNEICPRKNGFFAHPTPEICDVFYNCQDGKAIEVRCTGGLFFNELSGICEWPNTAGRTGCADPKSKFAFVVALGSHLNNSDFLN